MPRLRKLKLTFEMACYKYKCFYRDRYNMGNVGEPDIIESFLDSKEGWLLRAFDGSHLAHVNKHGYVKLNH